MTTTRASRFIARGALVAFATALVLAGLVVGLGLSAGWASLGLVLPVALTLAGGAWLARVHGKPGNAFLVALGVGLIARLVVLTAGAAAAAVAGGAAVAAYALGMALGFVSMLSFEAGWFYLADRRHEQGATNG